MAKSIWNDRSSFSVDSLSAADLKVAIKEWSEGNAHLERLLWLCHNNGVKTMGSCAHAAYIEADIEGSDINKLKNLFAAFCAFGRGKVILVFVRNPYGGPDWWKPAILFGTRDNVDEFFDVLSDALENGMDESFEEVEAFFNLYKFLKDKESKISFTITMDDRFKFWISCSDHEDYFSEFFSSSVLEEIKSTEEHPQYFFFEVADRKHFFDTMVELSKYIVTECNITRPEQISEEMHFEIKALLMRRKFGTDASGIKKLNEWLNTNKPQSFLRDVNY